MSSSERPSARSTGDGSWLAEAQAAPVDSASSGSSARRSSASIPGRQTLRLLGRRGSVAPFSRTSPSASHRPRYRRSRRARSRAASSRKLLPGQRARGAEADAQRRRQRARPQPALLRAAREQRRDAHATAQVQRADALGAVQLVRREAHEVDAKRRDVDRHPAGGLGGVGVQENAALPADPGDVGDRLEHADLVIGGHDRSKRGVGAQRLAQPIQVEQAVSLHRQLGELEPARPSARGRSRARMDARSRR